MTAKSNVVPLKRIRPHIKNGQVTPPKRVTNAERRTREHLTPEEVEKVFNGAWRTDDQRDRAEDDCKGRRIG